LPEKILITDDEHYVLEATMRRLRNRGYDVAGVESGGEALEKITQEPFDLILLDIKLPGMTGIELYKHMQKNEPSLAKKVVFVTGDVMGGDTRSFLSRTKAHYIVKPFSAAQLRKEVNGILSAGEKAGMSN